MELNQLKDIVERELEQPPEGNIIYPFEGGDNFDHFDSCDRYSERNCYVGEDFSGNQTSMNNEEVSFTVKGSDQEAYLEKQSYSEETLTSTPQLITEKDTQERVDHQEEKQPLKRVWNKKKKLTFKAFMERQAVLDQKVSSETIEKNDVSMPEKEGDQAASLERQSNTKETLISTPQMVSEKETIAETKETVDHQGEKQSFKCKSKKITTVAWETSLQPENIQQENLTPMVSDDKTSENVQVENLTEVSDNQTTENVQVENLTEVSDNQTTENVQVENLTEVSDNGNSEDAENNTPKRNSRSQGTRTYNSGAYPTHRRNNRHGHWNQYPAPPYPRPQRTPNVCYENPQFGHGNMHERSFDRYHNVPYPAAMPHPRPPPPHYIRHIKELQRYIKFVEDERWKNVQSLSEQTERRLQVEKKYNDCLTQLHLYEEALKDSKEIPNLPKSLEEQTNEAKCTCQVKFEENELPNMKVQEYLMKLLDEAFEINDQLNDKLKHQEDMLKKIDSERRQDRKHMVSAQVQTDLQESSLLKTIHYQTVSTQTQLDVQETRFGLIPVYQTTSTQTEMAVQDTRCKLKPVHQTISTQTETQLLVNVEEVKVSETAQNGDEQGEKAPCKKSKCKNKRKTSMETASELETLNDQKVSGENIEQQEVSTPGIVDQSVSLQNKIHTNETVISKPEQVSEEEKDPETPQNGDQQGEKKPSKKSKRRNRKKALLETTSKLETLNDQKVSGANIEQQEVSTPGIVDQSISLQNKIHTNETVIFKPEQVNEEEKVPETPQNGHEHGEKTSSEKLKCKNKRKTSVETASKPETLNDQKVSGENIEQQEVSTPGIVDQSISLQNEIHTNETVIFKPEQVNEEEKVPETPQNGDQQGEKKPSKKSKRRNRKKALLETTSKLETLNDQKVSGENTVSKPETVEDQTVSLQNEIHVNETVISKPQQVSEEEKITSKNQNLFKRAETVTQQAVLETKEAEPIKALVASRKSVCSQKEKQILTVLKVSKTPQGFKTQAAKKLPVQNNNSEQEESPEKKVSLWRRFKKAMTPSHRRQYKDREEKQPQ